MSDERDAKGKRTRSANYSHGEKNVLLNVVFKYKHIIESKRTDAVTWRDKEEAWKKITDHFNSNSRAGIYRSTFSLKKVYDNIKKLTRKGAADEKASIIRTGGGKAEAIVTDPNMDLALEIMNKKTVYGLENKYSDVQEQELIDSEVPEQGVPEVVEINENCEVDWGNYKADFLKKPVNPKLCPKSKQDHSQNRAQNSTNHTETIKENVPSTSSTSEWASRNRPVISTLASSDLSKKYEKLAEMKIEIAQMELDRIKAESQAKEERNRIEFELKKESLELDIKIKQAYLEKILKSSVANPFNLFSSS